MDTSVKILWGGAAAALVGAVLTAAFSVIWGAVASAALALTLMAAAYTHNAACLRRAQVLLEAEENARREVDAAQLDAEETRSKCDQEIVRVHRVLSHSLRVPVSIIVGYSELLRDGFADEKDVWDAYVRKIHAKAVYINELLGQVLLEMRTGTTMKPILKKPVQLLELLRKIASDMELGAARRGIAIKLVTECDEITIQGDAAGLTKAFYNIIENSLKYMGRRGSINITASLMDDGQALIIFKDDGLGMDSTEVERIFELEYQGSNKAEGEGLGLYIVKTEVVAHGGSVSAKSEPDKGMGIYITLPVSEESQF